ncbi:hypothetical protein ABPG73_012722 [Tetrahymena malaccensis]
MNRFYINLDIVFLVFAGVLFYFINYNSIQIFDKSPSNQREQSFIFPKNFTNLQTPLYSRLIFLIIDGMTYDFVDNRIKDIPFTQQGKCDIHVHQIKILNELLDSNPKSVIFQRMQIENPSITGVKLSTILTGINPAVLSKRIDKEEPNKKEQFDSLLYQVGNSPKLQKNYGFLTVSVYDFIGQWLNINQFAFDHFLSTYEELKESDEKKFEEYIKIIQSNQYDTLFIYEGLLDEIEHFEGQHTPNVLDAQKHIDKIITEIIKNMDDDAILIIASDHGKNEDGGHNPLDNNPNLLDSLFFAYTKKGFIKDDQFIESTRRLESDQRIVRQGVKYQAHESMISSTISNLLNIPISFISSGRPLIELYPASKFSNRVEMLQRILQDSFSTLEQQKQFYSRMYDLKKSFDYQLFEDTMKKIIKLENLLYYEQRDQYIYTENGLESLIKQILELQNSIQEQIYSYQNQSKSLFFFGIIFSIYVFYKITNKIKQNYLIWILIGVGIAFFIVNVREVKTLYGFIVTLALAFHIGVSKLKESKKIITLLGLLVQTLLICIICLTQRQSYLFYISHCSEIVIILIHSYQNSSLNKITILITTLLGISRFYNYDLACFCLNSLIYIYNHNNNNYEIKNQILKSRFTYQINILVLNMLYSFIGLVSDNQLLYELSRYYPFILLNLYLLSDLISCQQDLFNSFYLQTQIMIQAQLLFTIIGFQQHYNKIEYDLTVILIYYLSVPLIPEIQNLKLKKYNELTYQCKDLENSVANLKDQTVVFDNLQIQQTYDTKKYDIVQQNHANEEKSELSERGTQFYNQENQITQQTIQDNMQSNEGKQMKQIQLIQDLAERKNGIIFYCAIIIIFSCVSELLIIYYNLVFELDNNFFFSNNYQTASILPILFTNYLFINHQLIN